MVNDSHPSTSIASRVEISIEFSSIITSLRVESPWLLKRCFVENIQLLFISSNQIVNQTLNTKLKRESQLVF